MRRPPSFRNGLPPTTLAGGCLVLEPPTAS
jgi:hypothetical protein